jgi:hypothetical protein
MVIKLSSDVEAALNEIAGRQGISPEALANEVLRDRLALPKASPLPQDEWERAVLGLATDCGVSLPHAALSSQGLYE